MHHVVPWVPDVPTPLLRIASAGSQGVQLFFVASALTLFLSFDSRRGTQNRPLVAFFLRRFFRIAPLFYLAAVVYPWFFAFWSEVDKPSLSAVLATLGFAHVWHPGWVNQVVPGGWSIGVEMWFYLLVPWLPWSSAALLTRLAWTTTTAAGLFTYYWLPIQLPTFVLGVLLYFLVRGNLPAGE